MYNTRSLNSSPLNKERRFRHYDAAVNSNLTFPQRSNMTNERIRVNETSPSPSAPRRVNVATITFLWLKAQLH